MILEFMNRAEFAKKFKSHYRWLLNYNRPLLDKMFPKEKFVEVNFIIIPKLSKGHESLIKKIDNYQDLFLYPLLINRLNYLNLTWKYCRSFNTHRFNPKTKNIINEPPDTDRIIDHEFNSWQQCDKYGTFYDENKEKFFNVFDITKEIEYWLLDNYIKNI